MQVPLYEFPICIDFNDFMDNLEAEHGWKYRDMAGKYSVAGREKAKALKAQWLIDNGYAGKEHVLNNPVGSKIDWPVGSEEMNLRIEINQKLRRVEELFEVPYQDVWHWLLENAFYDLSNGSVVHLDCGLLDCDALDEDEGEEGEEFEDDSVPGYVRTVLKAIYEAVPEDHPARKHGYINFYIHW